MSHTPLCDDWACPARFSCAHFFGRSEAYARMMMPPPETRRGDRLDGEESCDAYELDTIKPWLTLQVAGRG